MTLVSVMQQNSNLLKHTNMIILGAILMLVGGGIFMMGEQGSCLLMIIGTAINLSGLALIINAF